MKSRVLFVLALLAGSAAAQATLTFTQIDGNLFTVSHRVKIIGSRAKATKMVYTKAASLCKAAGYSHMKVMEQESEANQQDDAANATLRLRFYFDDGEDRINCANRADPEYVAEANNKLAKRGYARPDAPATASSAPASGGSSTGSCTLEQIAAMARAGLPDEKIRAACTDG